MTHRAWLVCLLAGCADGGAASDDVRDSDPDTDDGVDTLTETFDAPAAVKVDLLLVVDDSASMVEEQELLAESTPALLAALDAAELDAHVGVVTTDMDDPERAGRLVASAGHRFVHATTPDRASVLADMIRVGSAGALSERGLAAAFTAFEDRDEDVALANTGFVRPDALAHVVVLSDEEDESAPSVTRAEFVSWASTFKGDASPSIGLSAIVGPAPSGCESVNGKALAGSVYLAVARALGGREASVCDTDWTPLLTGVVEDVRRAEPVTFELTQAALPRSVSVSVVLGDRTWQGVREVDDAACDASDCFRFSVRGPTVELVDWRPPVGAQIAVTYAPVR